MYYHNIIKGRNNLYLNSYLFSEDLHNSLLYGQETINTDYKVVSKKLGVYLVGFRVLNLEKKKVLIYNYIYYNPVFLETFLVYLLNRNEFSRRYNDRGDFLILLDNSLLINKQFKYLYNMDKEAFDKNKDNKEIRYFHSIKSLFYLINMMNDSCILSESRITTLFNLIYKLNFVTLNYKDLALIIIRALQLSYNEFLDSILGVVFKENISFKENIYLDNKSEILEEWRNSRYSIIDNCLFLLEDLESFIKHLRELGFNVNEGPQPWRGQVNSINSLLSLVDVDYRDSLYNHNHYHTKVVPKIDKDLYIPKSKFSFKNVHMNLGNVK